MENPNLQKPCLFNTAQGFSVSYNNKFLYSKYSPQKSILQTIQNQTILPGTLILCCSPILPYGILELLEKLPENCYLLLCEIDDSLREFAKEIKCNPEFKTFFEPIEKFNNVTVLTKEEILNLPEIINKPEYTFANGNILPKAGTFKRIIRIDFSAGIQLHSDFYDQLQAASTNAIMTFWSNRVTLVKFGRNYSSNFFNNLKSLPETTPIANYFNKITKPIVVFGAGQSIDSGIGEIKDQANNYYILCTDTSLLSLIQNGIEPDGVFIEEAQHIIIKAFIGANKTISEKTQVFAGLSSLPLINHNFPKNRISYFTTKYSDSLFFCNNQLKKLLPPENPPFGSVGLTTVYYALKFRKNDDVPVFIYGLDFSYSSGLTHGKGTMAHTSRLLSTNRFTPLQNYRAAYTNANAFLDKNHQKFYTTHILSSYAQYFNNYFIGEKNIFDSSDCGIPLAIPRKKPEAIKSLAVNQNLNSENITPLADDVAKYFNSEKAELLKIKDILTGNIKLPEQERNITIIEKLKCRDYLYLHFPDGWNFSTDISFLKRIRAELDYFIKLFECN